MIGVLDSCSHEIEPTFFPGHAAAIFVKVDGVAKRIGVFGILHPTVLDNFDLK